MQLIVEQQIRNLNTQHQAEHDLCGILRARNKVLTRIIQESGKAFYILNYCVRN